MLRALTTPRHSPRELNTSTSSSLSQPEREFPLDLLHSHWSHFAPDLLSRDEESRVRAASELRRCVELDLAVLSLDDSSRLVDDLTNRVFDLVNSGDTAEKLGGLTLLQQLLTMRAEQHDTILLRCMNVFRILFQQATLNAENRVIDLAARVLGFLCHTGAALTIDVANYHIRQALEWLSTPSSVSPHSAAPSSSASASSVSSSQFDRIDRRHLAAVYILRELSAQSPAIFASYVPQFTVAIWQGLKDARPETREASVAAVRNVLIDGSKRSPLMFANTCEQLYDEARNTIQTLSAVSHHPQMHPSASASSLSVPSSPLVTTRQVPRSPQPVHSQSPSTSKRTSVLTLPAVHASFLLLAQLIIHNRRMMQPHFAHVCDLAYKHRDTKDHYVTRALLQLLPLLASLRVDSFLSQHAEWMVDYILQQASAAGCVNGDLAMAAVSQLLGVVGEGMVTWVDGIVAAVMHVLASTSNGTVATLAVNGGANGSLLSKRKEKEREAERLKRMKRTSEAALECVGVMAKYLSLSFYPFADQLLDSMLRCPLSPALISSLSTITTHVPALTGDIQERLADMIINVLSAPFMEKDNRAAPAIADGPNAASAIPMHGHGHSYSISSFSALSSFSATTTGSVSFLPLSSPSNAHSLNNSFTSPPTSPLVPPAVDINKPTSPYQLPRHLQLHRLLPYPMPSLPDTSLLLLAFTTLSTFPFSFSTQFSLLALARYTMLNYLDDDNLIVRREAAITTLQLISKMTDAIATTYPLNAAAATAGGAGGGAAHTVNVQHLLLVCYDVVRKLMVLAVTDQSLNIRSSLLSLLVSDTRLDRFLLQSDLLSTLFLALHDEYSAIREAAILLLGRLSNKNPAVILPTLRRMLLLLLGEMQAEEVWGGGQGGVRGGGEGRRGLSQEEGAKMLGQLIGSCHALIKPYVDSILGVLVPKLGDREAGKDGQGGDGAGRRKRSEGLISSVLSTLGKLSVICGEDMTPFLDHLMPLLLEALYPPHLLPASAAATASGTNSTSVTPATATATAPPSSSSDHRQMTLRTLSLLLSSTSSVITPFIRYPHFLPCLLHLVRTDKSKAVRLECLRVIGVVGAIDPFEYRKCASEWVAVTGEGGGGGLGSVGQQGHGDGRMIRRGTSDSARSASVQAAPGVKSDKAQAEAKDDGKRDESADNTNVDGLPGGSPLTRQAQPGEAPTITEDDDVQHELYLCQSQSYDEYYPSVAIASLMRVIVDPRLLSHHSLSLSALMFILKSLGRDKCQPFLASIVPVFLREMRSCDDVLRESYLQQLSSIVQLVGGGAKEWVEELMDLALHFWPLPAVVTGLAAPIAPVFTASAGGMAANAPPPLLLPILSLFEQICIHLPSFFPTHLPVLLAKFLSLFADYPTEQSIASARCVLATLSVFSAHADLTAHLHFILPSLLDLCEEEDERSQRRPVNLRIDAVHAVGQLCYHHDCSSQASRILQPFARILASPTSAAGHVLPSTYSAIVSAGGPPVPHSVASSTHSSPVIKSAGLLASLLWSETLSAVCTIIPQLSFAFLLFEPIITRAIREHDKSTNHNNPPTGTVTISHPTHERSNSRMAAMDGRGLSREGGDRDSVLRERETVQVMRYYGIVERLKGKLNDFRQTSQRDGMLRTDEEDESSKDKERELTERLEREKVSDRDRRRKDRRSTMGRMSSHAEKDRDKERERELAAERERREQLRDKERDTIAFFPVIASASSVFMDDLDLSGFLPSPARFNASPGTSPAWQASSSPPLPDGESLPPLSLSINQQTLVRFFSSYHHSSSDDWTTWLRSLQLELLRESPSFALRACSSLAGKYPPLAKELMCAAFLSCWRDMDDQVKDAIIDAIIAILTAAIQPQPTAVPVPADIVLSILSLSDYCEQHDQRLPLTHRLQGAAAERYNSHARALYHYECLFRHNPSAAIEPLISVNNKLQLNDAAQGVLAMALRYEDDGIGEQWYEKLHRWDDALAAYERRQLMQDEEVHEDTLMGRMRCMKELQQWERLAALGSSTFLTTDDASFRTSIAPLVSAAVHQLRCWDLLEPYLPYLNENSFDGCYYRALYALHVDDSVQAQQYIDRACECVDGQLSGLLGESYTRAYGSIVRLQQCTELSEMIAYKSAGEDRKDAMRRMWSARLLGARKSVGVWSELLSVRALVMTPKDDVGLWLEYATLARKSGKLALSLKVLTALVGFEPTLLVSQPPAPLPTSLPQLTYSCLKHLYAAGHQRSAFSRLSELLNSDTMTAEESRPSEKETKDKLRSRCYLKLGTWQMELMGDELSVTNFMSYDAAAAVLSSPALSSMRREREDESAAQRNAAYNAILPQVLNYFHAATVCDPTSFAAWHQYAMLNFTVVQRNKQRHAQLSQRSSMHSSAANSTHQSKRGSVITLSGIERGRGIGPSSAASAFVGSSPTIGSGSSSSKLLDVHHHIVPAMTGFFRSIWLQKFGDNSRQDVLRVLQLWFEYGARKDVEQAMIAGINSINIDTWLAVIPQLIARLHTPYLSIRALLHELIAKIGKAHPQALVYPLVVAGKSHSDSRRVSAMHVLQAIRQHSEKLVNQASMVSSELVRVAILWHEMWHEAIEEASRHWFGNKSADGMLATLAPLHAMMEKGPTTTAEQQFAQQYGAELHAAHNYCNRYTHTNSTNFLTKAWEIYSDVFRSINKSLQTQQHIQLAEVSPKLLNAHDLQLAVPGSYTAAAPIVRIARFHPVLRVIDSKQHPRRLTIVGNDGRDYPFLLKGHEDLRQDERVMQLFGLVNTFLQLDRSTARSELSIVRYAVIPLSPNSGLIQWVPACDTLHALIKQYRDAKRIQLNIEQRLMLKQAPDVSNIAHKHTFTIQLTNSTAACEIRSRP